MDVNNMPAMNFSCYFECVLQEDSHIRQETFKVTIPSLFPNVENNTTPTKNSLSVDPSRSINKKNKSTGRPFVTTTIIEAKNHTDYAYKYRGDSFKDEMEKTDGITEPEQIIEGSYSDFKQHKHKIKAPITLKDYIYKNLNNVMVPKDSKAYGFFINGTYDTTSFVVVRIEGAVPLTAKDVIGYQKEPYKEDR